MASQQQQGTFLIKNEHDGEWTERFIHEIQSRPPIYNNRLPEHSDRQIIARLWQEICAAMVRSWVNLSAAEKSKAEKEMQGKWRNLRTCFRRELKKQKQGSSGQAAGKRRKYVFFDQLLFLLPTLDDRPTISECSPSEVGDACFDNEDDENSQRLDRSQQAINDIDVSQTSTQTQQPDKCMVKKKVSRKDTETYEQSLLNILKDKKEEPFDEDKSFLLSLVPTFKKLNDSQKLDAKMEFLATLKRLTQPSQSVPSFYQIPVGYPNYRPPNYNYNIENWQSTMSTPNPHTSETSRASGSMDPLSPTNEYFEME